jgi:pyroglutamyl-peptidase
MNMTGEKTILLTGFEPFGGFGSNPTALLAEKLEGLQVGNCRVSTCILPVVFGESSRMLAEKLRELAPVAVVCLGQAAGRSGITPERIAVNLDDADIPDNAGHKPVEQTIVEGAPAAYWSGLPVRKMVGAISALGIPVGVSMSAGTYVCNHVFYSLMHQLAGMPDVAGGFIHVPLMTGQVGDERPSLSLDQMEQGIRCALAIIVQELSNP